MGTSDDWNRCRFDAAAQGGHYESYFLRANHPREPLAFWVRYTIFAPRRNYASALGELWAVWFDGRSGRITAAKREMPLQACTIAGTGLDVRFADATLTCESAEGAIQGPSLLQWSLQYSGTSEPLLLLPSALYEKSLPRAKAVVPVPNAIFAGTFRVDAIDTPIDGWIGSQNHNWGSRHTDEYAWGQVAGFDEEPDSFLECSTARLRLGPLWTPWLTLAVLRLGGQELHLNSLWQAWKARERLRWFDWTFDSESNGTRVRAHISAPKSAFVALPYYNPPGGTKACLNTKIAACELVVERRGQPSRVLRSANRAAFEILTDRKDHGLPFAF